MNSLLLGTDTAGAIIDRIDFSEPFLLLDDGPIIDVLTVPKKGKVTKFAVEDHSIDPLNRIDFQRAMNFVAIMDAIFPEGQNTLTKKNSNFILLTALLSKPRSLETLVQPDPRNPAAQDAYQKIQTLLLSPVLRSVLTGTTNFPLSGTILARFDRAILGDFVSFALASFLVSQYKGQVIISDFGFYGRTFHLPLIRQNRLTARVRYLDEVPGLRDDLLTIPHRTFSGTSFKDAETLAQFAGLVPKTNAYNAFIEQALAP